MDSRGPEERGEFPAVWAIFRERFPSDLSVVFVWIILSILGVYLPALNASPLRVLFALPMILFIPGYVLIAALFPGKKDIDSIERVILSFGISIAVVPLIGLGLNYTPWGIRLDPIVTSTVTFSVVMIVIAQLRRILLPPGERFVVPFERLGKGVKEEFFPRKGSRIDRILSIVVLIAIVAAVGTTLYVIAAPKEGEKFTEFYILDENGMAADLPDRLSVGAGYPMYIGIGNHEYRNVTYTAETWLVQMDLDERTNVSTISRMDPVNQFSVTLPHNETGVLPYTLTAPSTGYNRVDFLLFNESVAGSSIQGMDRINASYHDLHLWVKLQEQPTS